MMQKKVYETADIQLRWLQEEDIVTASTMFDDGEDEGTRLPPIFE